VLGAGANLSDALRTFDNSLIGNTYTLYLDNHGNILGHKLVESAVSNYAVVLGSSLTGNGTMGYEGRVKVLLADGTQATYDVDLKNSAVKLGLAAASATESAKEAAIVTSGWFQSNGLGTNLIDNLFSYTLDEDSVITLCNPHTVNSAYTTAVFDAAQTLKKAEANYDVTGGTVVADDTTVFFIKNSNNTYRGPEQDARRRCDHHLRRPGRVLCGPRHFHQGRQGHLGLHLRQLLFQRQLCLHLRRLHRDL